MATLEFARALENELLKVLGLPKSTRSFSLFFDVDSRIPIVRCEYYLFDSDETQEVMADLGELEERLREATNASSDVVGN
jgi:hypothetical protein